MDTLAELAPELATGNIIDNSTGEWTFASMDQCEQLGIYKNMLAYNAAREALCLITKRSRNGTDFPLSEAGLNFALDKLREGKFVDGRPIKQALVVLAEADAQAPRLLRLKVIEALSTEQAKARAGEFQDGAYGRYCWIGSVVWR